MLKANILSFRAAYSARSRALLRRTFRDHRSDVAQRVRLFDENLCNLAPFRVLGLRIATALADSCDVVHQAVVQLLRVCGRFEVRRLAEAIDCAFDRRVSSVESKKLPLFN